MLNTYKPLPEHENADWWSIRFLDGDRDNISLSNMEWYDEKFVPYLVPGINIDINSWVAAYGNPEIELKIISGEMRARNAMSFHEIGLRLNKDGYYLITSPLTKEVIRFHRLVALTFLEHPIDTDHLTVNHKDSNKQNNLPYNLEWASYSENNKHSFAEGPRGDTIRKIIIHNLETGSDYVASGYNDAGRYLKVAPGSVHSVMTRRNYEGKPYKGHLLKYSDDTRSWSEIQSGLIVEYRHVTGKVAVKNCDTNDVIIYDSFDDVLDNESINKHSLFRLLDRDDLIPWRRRLFQKVGDKPLKWPEYPKGVVDVYSKIHASDRPIKVVDSKGTESFHTSLTHWCMEDRDNRCDPAVLSRYMKKSEGKPLRWRDWVFSYIDLNEYHQT